MATKVYYETGIIKSSAYGFETDDCTVRALANTVGYEYGEAHAYMKQHGRKDRRGMRTMDIRRALKALPTENYETKELDSWKKEHSWSNPWMTIKQFIKANSIGTFYICVKGHALAIVDGKVVDSNMTGVRSQVRFAMEIIKKSEKETKMEQNQVVETSLEAKEALKKAKRKARRLARKAKAAAAQEAFVAQFAAHSTAEAMAEALAS